MDDVTRELKTWARLLQRALEAGDPAALPRARRLPELRALEPAALVGAFQRRHALAIIALELGFQGWSHLTAVLSGAEQRDLGTALLPPRCKAHWNIWSARYEEAAAIRAEHGGYLLAWKYHFLVVDADYIESLGLDPADPDWEAIGRDWARPRDLAARARLYGRLFACDGASAAA